VRRTYITNENGAWKHAQNLSQWPHGLVPLQFAATDHDRRRLAELMRLIIRAADLVLRTPQGVRRYLVGAPLCFDNISRAEAGLPCPGLTNGAFVFPTMYFPYLSYVLGVDDIDLCSEDAWATVDAASRHAMQLTGIIARDNNERSEYVKDSLQNLCRLTVPIGPNLLQYRKPWGSPILNPQNHRRQVLRFN
jgi:hypothetical protein